MKNVLITGANSYVGTSVEKWLMEEPDQYHVETLDMKDSNWKKFDFSKFDVVFHVAGIAHVSTKKSMKDLYYEVNRDLAIETAQKAKEAGVKQFIFMSSMIVYGSKVERITKDTIPNPDNFYGDSKLQAEKGISNLISDEFTISILRPPMIYGPESKGNFSKLINFTKKSFIFPNYNNRRSMLFIDNLCMFIMQLIDSNTRGLFFPKNVNDTSTTNIVRAIAIIKNKKLWFTKLFNIIITIFKSRINILNKLFGDLYYDFVNVGLVYNYEQVSVQSSIQATVLK